MNTKFQVRYKSTMQGTMALFDTYNSHGEAVHAASQLKESFRRHGLAEEAKSVEISSK